MRFDHPTYISLDVPEPNAAVIADWRGRLDPGFADLPVEVAIAGSSGVGVLSHGNNASDVLAMVDHLGSAFGPIAARFTSAEWLDDLKVHALVVDQTPNLLRLHAAAAASGISFEREVPATFRPHCALRWTQKWMSRRQERIWQRICAAPPREEFVFSVLTVYQLRAGASQPAIVHRVRLGG